MTTPKDIKNDLNDVSEHILGSLGTPDRLRLAIEAMAVGDEEHIEKLTDTAPWKTYRQPDARYQDGLQQSLFLSLSAKYELARGVWLFHLQRLQGLYFELLAREFEVSGEGWEFVEEPSPENDFGERLAMEAAARFLADYLAWKRFAADIFGVDLQTFLSLTTLPECLETIEDMADLATGANIDLDGETPDGTPLSEVPERESFGWAGGMTIEIGDEDLPPEQAAELKATQLAKSWFEDGPAVAVDTPTE